MLAFAGEAFETDNEHKRLKSLLIGEDWWGFVVGQCDACLLSFYIYLLCFSDFFRGPTVSAVRLAGLEHILHFTALDGKIFMRSYRY